MNVQITIRGRHYTVRSDEGGGDIREIAADLDARLAEVASRTRTPDEYTIALLTALNLASETRQLRAQLAQRLDELDREVASISAFVESALPREDGA